MVLLKLIDACAICLVQPTIARQVAKKGYAVCSNINQLYAMKLVVGTSSAGVPAYDTIVCNRILFIAQLHQDPYNRLSPQYSLHLKPRKKEV